MSDAVPSAGKKTVFGRYHLQHRIASGSSGSVYAARDERDGSDVVVKFFDVFDDGLSSWVSEMRLAMRMKHPNIVPCLDTGFDEEQKLWVLVFKRGMGGSLRRAMVAGCEFDEAALRGLLLEMARALAFAHSHQVVHRDVKPENIIAEHSLGQPPWQITDFGVGRFLLKGSEANTLVGSFAYMAPEVLELRGVAASDQFSLGMVIMELLLGRMISRKDRAEFVLEHRYRQGLRGIVARLCDCAIPRRLPDLACLEALLDEEGGAFDLGTAPDGTRYLLHQDRLSLWKDDRQHAPEGMRVPKAKRFVSIPGAPLLVSSHRRIIAVDGETLSTLYVADSPFDVLAASAREGMFWIRRGAELTVVDSSGTAHPSDVPLPEQYLNRLEAGGYGFGDVLPGGTLVFAVDGLPEILFGYFEGGEVRFRTEPLSLPVRELYWQDEHLLACCGDHENARFLHIDATGTRSLGTIAAAADNAWIEQHKGDWRCLAGPEVPAQEPVQVEEV